MASMPSSRVPACSPQGETTAPTLTALCTSSPKSQVPHNHNRTLQSRPSNPATANSNAEAHESDEEASGADSEDYRPESDPDATSVIVMEAPTSDTLGTGPSHSSAPAKRRARQSSGGHADSEAAQKKQRTNGSTSTKGKKKAPAKAKAPIKKTRKRLAPLQKVS